MSYIKESLPATVTISREKNDPRFIRLITNSNEVTENAEESTDSTLCALRNYFAQIIKVMQGRVDCPYAFEVERKNGYRIALYDEHPQDINIIEIFEEMKKKFNQLSSAITEKGQPIDPHSIVAAFSHPLALEPEFCLQLDELRNTVRLNTMRSGMMMSQMHPHHPATPGRHVSFVSPVPMINLRRMHQADRRILEREPATKIIFENIFDRA